MEVIWAKTFIWGFKQSFLSPCSLKAFYDLFSPQILLFAQIPPNVTTQTLITFHEKIFENFFWSHGAPLGYLGFLSQKGHPEIFSKWVLINLSNPLRHPTPLVDPLLTKNLDTAGPWCDWLYNKTARFSELVKMIIFSKFYFYWERQSCPVFSSGSIVLLLFHLTKRRIV